MDEPHLPLPHIDTPSGEEVPVAPPQLEGEAAAAMRPSLTSGYSKQFQKSLPPRFLRQQVRVSTSYFLSFTLAKILMVISMIVGVSNCKIKWT